MATSGSTRTTLISPFQYFADPTRARPIFNGFIFIGRVDGDPTNTADQIPVQVICECGGSPVNVTQPIRTGPGGLPIYNGSPAQIVVCRSNYSITLQDNNRVQVYHSPNVQSGFVNQPITHTTLAAAMADDNSSRQLIRLLERRGAEYRRAANQAEYDSAPDSAKFTDAVGGLWVLNAGGEINVRWLGATGDGITDDTLHVRAAFAYAGDNRTIYFPDGGYVVSADGNAITMDNNDCRVVMDGWIVIAPNASGFAPDSTIRVNGDRNNLQLRLRNSADVGKDTSTSTQENPMNGVFVTGDNNTVENSFIFNFVAPLRLRGPVQASGNRIINNRVTVKSISNLAWSNDMISVGFNSNAIVEGNYGAIYDSTNPNSITFEDNPIGTQSLGRVGINFDANCYGCIARSNHVGESFAVGMHSEGLGDRFNSIHGNVIYKQKRSSITAAGKGVVKIYSNICHPVMNILDGVPSSLIGQIGSIETDSEI